MFVKVKARGKKEGFNTVGSSTRAVKKREREKGRIPALIETRLLFKKTPKYSD